MATTINNTTVNTRMTIIFDAGVNPNSTNDGPASGTGNTESDVYLDNSVFHNIRSPQKYLQMFMLFNGMQTLIPGILSILTIEIMSQFLPFHNGVLMLL
ncbi:MAG: hypothetical protein CM15mV49_840 [uncultured marine virus]|nr:MAG: hypothetical protein CM15mV49_840 [uncultured marine virus]